MVDDPVRDCPAVVIIGGTDVAIRAATALEAEGVDVTGDGQDIGEAASRLGGSTTDVVVVALGDSRAKSREELQALRRQLPDTRIVAVAATPTTEDVRDALGDGADGVVLEDEVELCLALTIKAVCRGQIVVPASLKQSFLKPSLSVREKQVLAMVILGFSNGEIASKLYVTESTVKSHLSSAFKKLGVRSRTQATEAILDPEHGLGTGILAISNGADRDE
jgi:two-component system NarL family response regulator